MANILEPINHRAVNVSEVNGGQGGVEVAAVRKTLTLTKYPVTFTRNVEVLPRVKAITLVRRAASITRAQNVAVNLKSLTLTRRTATIFSAKVVSASFKAMALTTYKTHISLININAGVKAFTLTKHAAAVARLTNISASTKALVLTTHAASLVVEVDIRPPKVTQVITTNPAEVVVLYAPVLSIPALTPARVYRPLSIAFAPYITQGIDITSWTLTGDTIAGMTFDTATGVYSGTPTETGLFGTFTITAVNSVGSGSGDFTLRISTSIARPEQSDNTSQNRMRIGSS